MRLDSIIEMYALDIVSEDGEWTIKTVPHQLKDDIKNKIEEIKSEEVKENA